MTLEEAIRELAPEMENLRRKSLDYPQTTYLGAKDARLLSALAIVTAVARAFPKMLEALENIRQIEEYVKGRPCLRGEPGCVQCLAISALRAAREAVKP